MPRHRLRFVAGVVLALAAAGWEACTWRPKAEEGRRLRILSPGLPDRLDPTQDSRLGSRNIYLNVFEPLVRVDTMGHLIPALAESWANPSPDLYSFRLRSGVRFHDGERLDAAQVVASLQAAQAPASLVAGNLADVIEVRAADPLSVEVRTRTPTAVLLPALTAVLVQKPARDGSGPVGTGPFLVAEFRRGESILLRRFDDYYQGRPLLEEVAVRRFDAAEEVVEALKAAEPTAVLDPPRAAVDLALRDARFRVVSELSGSLVYLAFNLNRDAKPAAGKNAFLDVRVRRAFQCALDLDALVREATPLGGLPATQLVPPGVFGFDPGRPVPTRDLSRARELLKQAGYPSGFGVVLDVRRNDLPLGESLARQLAEPGVRVEVNPLSSDEFLKKRTAGESVLFAYNWVVGEDSGESLKNFFHTRRPEARLGVRNLTGYSNADVDTAVDDALSSLDQDRRLALLRRAMSLLMEDLPWIPLYADKTTRIYPSDLAFPRRIDGIMVLSEATLTGH